MHDNKVLFVGSVLAFIFFIENRGADLNEEFLILNICGIELGIPQNNLLKKTEVRGSFEQPVSIGEINDELQYDALTIYIETLVSFAGKFDSKQKIEKDGVIFYISEGHKDHLYRYIYVTITDLKRRKTHSMLVEVRGEDSLSRIERWKNSLLRPLE